MPMKNVTISLDEDVARWIRIWAAKQDTSVSRLVGELLRERMRFEEGYEQARLQYLSLKPKRVSSGEPYPARDDLHDRNDVR